MGFIYLRNHWSTALLSIVKMGKTSELINRASTYTTGEYTKGEYIFIAEIYDDSPIDHNTIELRLQKDLYAYHKRHSGGREFYSKEIMNHIGLQLLKYKALFKIYDTDEIKNIEYNERIHNLITELKPNLIKYMQDRQHRQHRQHKKHMQLEQIKNDELIINKYRDDIQREYVMCLIHELSKNQKAFLKAPTGFGKTHIIYKLIAQSKYAKILILTPRKLLNEQCADVKYTKYITGYKFMHYNKNNYKRAAFINHAYKCEKLIMTSCYQSIKSLYDIIKKHELYFDLIIFDEAHYASHKCKYNLGHHNLFVSATPHELIINQPDLFGNIIEKIKIYDLIQNKILCNIVTLIKKIDVDIIHKHNYSQLCTLIIKSMKQYGKRKGIIYVNNTYNATAIYNLIKDDIHTYIYISKKIKDIEKYWQNITNFEKDKAPAIIICIGKISYGYDNSDIDFICLGDVRQSAIDIRQIIGRGLRWNKQDYPNKILHMLIPIYYNEFIQENTNLTQYLDYIIGECGNDLILYTPHCVHNDIIHKTRYSDAQKNDLDENYADITELYKYSTIYYAMYSNFMKFLIHHKVYNIITYVTLSKSHDFMPEINDIHKRYPKFAFINLYSNKNLYYETKADCKFAINICKDILIKKIGKIKYSNLLPSKKLHHYNSIDNKIPNMKKKLYYGI